MNSNAPYVVPASRHSVCVCVYRSDQQILHIILWTEYDTVVPLFCNIERNFMFHEICIRCKEGVISNEDQKYEMKKKKRKRYQTVSDTLVFRTVPNIPLGQQCIEPHDPQSHMADVCMIIKWLGKILCERKFSNRTTISRIKCSWRRRRRRRWRLLGLVVRWADEFQHTYHLMVSYLFSLDFKLHMKCL